MGVHESTSTLSTSTRGSEREGFVRLCLDQLFPAVYRFGHGDITDSSGNRSGQCDIVIEYPFIPSIPVPGGGARLYLADGVAAVIEVKSNLEKQWGEVVNTAAGVAQLHRNPSALLSAGPPPGPRIPVFAVGYTGWATYDTLAEKVSDSPVDGAIIIDRALFAIVSDLYHPAKGSGAVGLWLLITALNEAMTSLKLADPSLMAYCTPDTPNGEPLKYLSR
jgi:hypothetical protein